MTSSQQAALRTPARYDAVRDPVPTSAQLTRMARDHWTLQVSKRSQSPYADAVRTTGYVRHMDIHDNLKKGLYLGGPAENLPPHEVFQHVISRLDSNDSDQARMIDFLKSQCQQFLRGEHVALPAYYHCTQESSFEEIMNSERPKIKSQTPRTGNGMRGAWLSTKPEVSFYGSYVFSLNRNVDYLYSTQSPELGSIPPRKEGNEYHIAIQESISLEADTASSKEQPLAFIGVPDNEVNLYRSLMAQKGGQFIFINSQGKEDVAVFSTRTVQSFALAMAEVEPPKVPKSWADSTTR
ncbi:hypothetical protein KDW41_29355 [Burkholderia vietnamiensis]|nr:hypothetical protein [Burkholderia vietnamiensis]